MDTATKTEGHAVPWNRQATRPEAPRVSDQANLSSFDHRQGSSNERPKDHGFKS
jgi:hypothetical protein